ncbi:(2Fe-2S)-binding protein, partial [Candidatus Sumerlaeota bacterium]|nr:(2Fe-2S)-binding protein [Candidatus Sumerlaeota bacterium]
MNEEKPRKIKVTIDGQEIEVERGTTILNAARELGIEIPTLCYNPLVEAYASCRICSVEVVRGKRHRIVTACNYPLEQDGLQVYTNNERVRRNRAMIIELLLARCPDVPVLQELARQYGVEESRFGKGDEKCILCGLCVRVCEEIVGVCAINFAFSGTERIVTTPFDEESDVCIACGACAYVCPTGAITLEDFKQREVIHNEIFLGPATAIRVPTLQAVPNAPVIDTEHCIHFQTGGCGHCSEVCEAEAINYDMQDEEVKVDVGNIIITTGYDQFDPSVIEQYGYGRYDNVLTALEFERMNCAAGSTGGRILLANGKEPKSVGIIHCVGSRDKNYHEYCSRVCCMYALKYGHLIKEKTNAEVYNFYIDLRCFGKGYEEFYHRLLEEGVRFIRGKAAEITDYPVTPA